MHLQITNQYMKYKNLKYSCSILINFSNNNNKTKGCTLILTVITAHVYK